MHMVAVVIHVDSEHIDDAYLPPRTAAASPDDGGYSHYEDWQVAQVEGEHGKEEDRWGGGVRLVGAEEPDREDCEGGEHDGQQLAEFLELGLLLFVLGVPAVTGGVVLGRQVVALVAGDGAGYLRPHY